ncbi:hypothetical protein G7Y79_00043g079830 [Physcia stellaris]|nr:hypothetical protein G7Y79_00043g079830 [Physcia stellaris]
MQHSILYNNYKDDRYSFARGDTITPSLTTAQVTITPPPITVTSVSVTTLPGITVTATISLDASIKKRDQTAPIFAHAHAIGRRESYPQAVYCAIADCGFLLQDEVSVRTTKTVTSVTKTAVTSTCPTSTSTVTKTSIVSTQTASPTTNTKTVTVANTASTVSTTLAPAKTIFEVRMMKFSKIVPVSRDTVTETATKSIAVPTVTVTASGLTTTNVVVSSITAAPITVPIATPTMPMPTASASASATPGCPTCNAPTATGNDPATCTSVTFCDDDEWCSCGVRTTTYTEYFTGSGVRENDNNPGNPVDLGYNPFTVTLDDAPVCELIQECAGIADNSMFFSFNLYYLMNEDQWVCTIYAAGNDDTSYFNVQDSNIGDSFGYNGIQRCP